MNFNSNHTSKILSARFHQEQMIVDRKPVTLTNILNQPILAASCISPLAGLDVSYYANLGTFLAHLDKISQPRHRNYYDLFKGARILEKGWLTPTRGFYTAPSKHRIEGFQSSSSIMAGCQIVLEASGYLKEFPILLDKDNNLIDGYHRFWSMEGSECMLYFVKLDV